MRQPKNNIMYKTKKSMSAFTALNKEQQRSIMGGQNDVQGAADALRKLIDTLNGTSTSSGASTAGSAAGTIAAGTAKP